MCRSAVHVAENYITVAEHAHSHVVTASGALDGIWTNEQSARFCLGRKGYNSLHGELLARMFPSLGNQQPWVRNDDSTESRNI
ncbi:hypothetical protein BaRGS_00028079 [Batillaria attramentaria]|uniref:Uncharacterized protein n=1 Tax=Batillaria attramentaria TaxID=370345 RepID=A0ABD0K031_9CAEN